MATGIGALTVTAHWHRLSDTLGSDLIALALGSLAAFWMLRRGLVEHVEATRVYRGRVVYIVGAAALAALALVLGVLLGIASAIQGLEDEVSRFNAYLAAQSLASAGSSFAALAYWGTWHRLTLRERRRSTS